MSHETLEDLEAFQLARPCVAGREHAHDARAPRAVDARGRRRAAGPGAAAHALRRRLRRDLLSRRSTAARASARAHQRVFTEESAPYEMPFVLQRARRSPSSPRRSSTSAPRSRRSGTCRPSSGRRDLGPVPLRADRRLRPGRAADPGHPGRRRVHAQRLEDLELGRLPGRLRPVPGPHRLARAQAPGPDHVHRQDPPAGHRGPADQDGQRGQRVLPGVLRRRRPARRERASARSTTAGRWPPGCSFHERDAVGGGSPYVSGIGPGSRARRPARTT